MASKLALKEVFENQDIVHIIVNFLPKNTKRMELHALSRAFKAAVHRDLHISRRCVDPVALIMLAGPDLITLTIDRDVAMPGDERGCDYTEMVSNRMIRVHLCAKHSWEGHGKGLPSLKKACDKPFPVPSQERCAPGRVRMRFIFDFCSLFNRWCSTLSEGGV